MATSCEERSSIVIAALTSKESCWPARETASEPWMPSVSGPTRPGSEAASGPEERVSKRSEFFTEQNLGGIVDADGFGGGLVQFAGDEVDGFCHAGPA